MSPLDRLQELLDERGVKHERRSFVDYGRESVEYVIWRGIGGLEFNAIRSYSDPDMLYIDNTIISPEDAVNVTVGRETCHMELLPDEPTTSIQPMRCTSCGHKTYAQLASYCPHCGARVTEAERWA